MILKGSQRGGTKALAIHLLNADDNEHVEVEAINGFMSNTVEGAFQEIYAASQATSCSQFLFSLSLSPPENAIVSKQNFRDAIVEAMNRLGLAGQPHVVIFHEKNGRRHAHLVVSRIDGYKLKAINLPFFKDRLCDLSRELYLTHNWELPQGHVDRALSDPLNYSLEEHQVGKRAKRDPKPLKKLLKDCWEQSDSKAGFAAALHEAGFQLCRGTRRGYVAVDHEGNVYSLSRWLGVKSKDLKLRLGSPEILPSIEHATQTFKHHQNDATSGDETAILDPQIAALEYKISALSEKKADLISVHRSQRKTLIQNQQEQRINQIKILQQSSSSLRDFWNLITGKRQAIIAERQAVMDVLVEKQELASLQLSNTQRIALRQIRTEIAETSKRKDALLPKKTHSDTPQQQLEISDPDSTFHAQQIRRSPDYILKLINDKKAAFTRKDILRELARYLNDPQELREISDRVLRSSELLPLEGGNETNPHFTTHSFYQLETDLLSQANSMAVCKSHGVLSKYVSAAIQKQNATLQKSVGANLSDEQCAAIEHVLNRKQLSAVVGLAGAGKSTLLSAASHAWTAQGYRVLGAALSGKATDGLQQASNIPSRTLASWEMSWKHERNLLGAGDVLVIDEAGMVGSAQLSRIVKEVRERKAKLVLVGDPDQLQPINAGAPFRKIADQIGFAELSKIRRQKHKWQIKASIDLARGRTAEAIQAYHDHGAIEFAQTRSDAITALVEDYMVDYETDGNNKSRIALAHRRKDVFAINQAIRAAKKSAGELVNEQAYKTDNGVRTFAAGDRLLFTRNEHQLGVRNGMLGTVETIGYDQMTVCLDGESSAASPRQIQINSKQYIAFDHGYATTIHKSQGATVDNAYVLSSRTMDRNLSYVALTRHRHVLRIFAATNEVSDINKLIKQLEQTATTSSLSSNVSWQKPDFDEHSIQKSPLMVTPEIELEL